MPEIQGVHCDNSRGRQHTMMPTTDFNGDGCSRTNIPVSGFSSVQSMGLNNDRVPEAKASGITWTIICQTSLTNITRAECRAAETITAVTGKNLVNNLNYRDTCTHLA